MKVDRPTKSKTAVYGLYRGKRIKNKYIKILPYCFTNQNSCLLAGVVCINKINNMSFNLPGLVYATIFCLSVGFHHVKCLIPDINVYNELNIQQNVSSSRNIKNKASEKIKVGICLPEWEKTRLEIANIIGESLHLSIKDIDMEKSIEDQGPFDIIFHKILKWFDKDPNKGQSYLDKLVEYHQKYNHITLIDPIENGIKLANRSLTLDLAKQCEFTLGNKSIFLPKYVFLKEANEQSVKRKLKDSAMSYPIIAKKLIGRASLTESHDMRIIFSEDRLKDLSLPCVVQEFRNHGGKMFKVYVIGEKFYVCEKPSIRNFHVSHHKTLFFDSTNITKGEYFPSLHEQDPSVINFETSDQKELLDRKTISVLIQRLKSVLHFNMLGIDIIIDEETKNYGIIDLNYSPSFHCVMPHFSVDLLEVFVNIGNQLKVNPVL